MRILRALWLAVPAAALAAAAPAMAQSSAQRAAFASTQAYAIEVAPGTYVIHRPDARSYPYVGCGADCAPAEPAHPIRRHERAHNNRALIEELRRRHSHESKGKVIHTTRIVREKPVVIEHRRVVDDPPRVVERVRVEEGPPARPMRTADLARVQARRKGLEASGKRVIRAEAEVTILGPDRMTIRLLRKRDPRHAEAQE